MSLRGGAGGFPLFTDKHPYTGPVIGVQGARGHLSGLGYGDNPLNYGGRWSRTEEVRETFPQPHSPYATSTQLGCCDDQWGHMGQLAGLDGLGTCPGPTVIVEDNPIPMWVWLAVGIWGVLMVLKKR